MDRRFSLLLILLSFYTYLALGDDHVHRIPDNADLESILHDDDFIQDSDHLREDVENAFGFFFGFTQDSLEFSFFALHDYDNNTKLDGLELLSSLSHTHHHKHQNDSSNHNSPSAPPPPINKEEILQMLLKNQEIVDRILKDDDVNNDGYISYPEYKISRSAKKVLNT